MATGEQGIGPDGAGEFQNEGNQSLVMARRHRRLLLALHTAQRSTYGLALLPVCNPCYTQSCVVSRMCMRSALVCTSDMCCLFFPIPRVTAAFATSGWRESRVAGDAGEYASISKRSPSAPRLGAICASPTPPPG